MTHPIFRASVAPLLAVAGLLAGAAPAHADDTYSNDVRLGLYAVFYHTTADDLQGPYVPPGVNIKAEDLATLYFGYVRRLSPHFSAELAVGYPPLAKIEGKGPATLGSVPFNGQVISTARWIAPTVLLEYNFFDETAKLRPFIGVGVNYTTFYDRDSTAEGNAASGGPTKLSLKSSVGPAATAGATYKFGGHWDFTASYSISRVNTRLVADTAGLIRTTSIKFGPQALILSVGYRF
jgi:outer membrane protein